MTHRKAVRKIHIGRPIDFKAFDGKVYNGKVLEVFRCGVHIRYYVPQVMRECDSHVPNSELNRIEVY